MNFLLFFRFEQLRENLRVKEDNTSNYEYDNSTSEECNELMEWMESGTFTNIIWSIFKVTMFLQFHLFVGNKCASHLLSFHKKRFLDDK